MRAEEDVARHVFQCLERPLVVAFDSRIAGHTGDARAVENGESAHDDDVIRAARIAGIARIERPACRTKKADPENQAGHSIPNSKFQIPHLVLISTVAPSTVGTDSTVVPAWHGSYENVRIDIYESPRR